MKFLWKLAFSQLRYGYTRVIFSSLAIAAATCLIVWMVAGYETMISGFHDDAEVYMGRYDLVVVPFTSGPPRGNTEQINPNVSNVKPGSTKSEPPKEDGQKSPNALENRPSDAKGLHCDPVQKGRGNVSLEGSKTSQREHQRDSFIALSSSLLDALRQDSAIAACEPMMMAKITATAPRDYVEGQDPRSVRIGIPQNSPTLVGIGAAESPYELGEGRWLDTTAPDALECVLGSGTAHRMKLNVGDEIIVTSDVLETRLKIVGLVEQAMDAPVIGPNGGLPTASLFVPIATAEKISGRKFSINLISIELKDGVDESEFRQRWEPVLKSQSPRASFADTDSIVRVMSQNRNVGMQKSQTDWTLGVTLLAAIFIIFTTLSMGVNERVRQLALLRAIALSRKQIAGIVFMEGFFHAIPGWLAGTLTSALLFELVCLCSGTTDKAALSLHWSSVWLSGGCVILGAAIAAIVPAWRASRLDPMSVLQNTQGVHQTTVRKYYGYAFIGAVLIAIHFAIVYIPGIPVVARGLLYATVGCVSMTVGFLLWTPLLILGVEKCLGRLIARLLYIHPRMLDFSLSGNMGRTIGTTASLSIGLGLFVSIQVWGFTMLVPFLPNPQVPNALVAFLPEGIPESEISQVENTPGIKKNEFLPVAVEQTPIAVAQLATPGFESTRRENQNVVLAGFDIVKGMYGKDAIFHLNFIDGNAEEAREKLTRSAGRYCLIPDTIQTQTGLGIGDKLQLVPPKHRDQAIEYEIAGVVYIPGSIWLTKTSGMRRQGGRTLGLVLTNYENVKADFELDAVGFFWMNLEENIQPRVFESQMLKISQQYAVRPNQMVDGTEMAATRPFAKLWYAPEIIESVGNRSSGIIWGMSWLPLIILIITSLGVVNTIIASIRMRTWEMGVLRAIGFTRSTLVKQVLAEAILIGLVAILLSFAFGVTAGWCSVITARYMYVYAVTGLTPDLTIPWDSLGIGFGLTMLLCVAAAIIPAIRTGRREIAELLRSGRAITE